MSEDQIELEDLIAHAKAGEPPAPSTPADEGNVTKLFPRAAVDKTLAMEQAAERDEEPREEEAVDPVFERLPDNVEMLPTTTTQDIPPARVLQAAMDEGMIELVVCGLSSSGEEYVASNTADVAVTIYHLSRALHFLQTVVSNKVPTKSNVAGA